MEDFLREVFLNWDPEGMSWSSPGRVFKARGSRAYGSLRGLVNGVSEGIGGREDCRDETQQGIWGHGAY